jgi:hypothetical protein
MTDQQPGRLTPAQAAAAIFADPFITDPCREGTHDCRFSGCQCPGHRGTRPGTRCTLGREDSE